jgi:hypothetical protein
MFQKPFIIGLFLILCSSCKEKDKRADDVLLMVKETGPLVTAEYTLSKIIKADDNNTWYKIGNRKILMSCEALVKAGINLENLTEKNIQVEDDSITLLLPPPQFFSLHIPADRIKVEYEEVDVLRDPFTAAEREGLLAQAETSIRQTVDSLGILKMAGINGALYLKSLLKMAGYSKVHVRYQINTPLL